MRTNRFKYAKKKENPHTVFETDYARKHEVVSIDFHEIFLFPLAHILELFISVEKAAYLTSMTLQTLTVHNRRTYQKDFHVSN